MALLVLAIAYIGPGCDFDFVGDTISPTQGRLIYRFCYKKRLFARFSEPPPSCLETFQSKIDNQFKMCELADVDDMKNQVQACEWC